MNEEIKIIDGELEKYKKEAEENLAGWKRALSDYQNLKKDMERASVASLKYGAQTVLSALLPALDHFRDAITHIPKEDESRGWVQGILLIKKELEEAVKQFGVEVMESVGEKFDPSRHEAVGEDLPSEALAKEGDGGEPGIVLREVQKGYMQNGEILRPSKVIISK